ncbi:MAG: diguanylate cyclase [Phycisphaerales bacterium]|nr:diguanylate cyclase [Phycisphaerales bacterium]
MTTSVAQPESDVPSILVIDDSVDVHRLLTARLKSEGVQITCVKTGEEGLRLLRDNRPTLILLDLVIPGMDGFEILRRIKDDPKTMDIPVIVLSGLSSPQDKVTAFDLGAVDYICKPFDLTELRVRVRAAIRLSRLLTMLAQRAQIDGLTGLYNRAHFDARWREVVATASRKARPISLAVFDADHFKSINDTYGHPAGDAVLVGIGAALQKACRASDIPCRFGGEEFCLIMPDTTPEDALLVCDRIRLSMGEMVWSRHPERKVTVSIGIVGSHAAGAEASAAQWLEAADKNLYRAKQGGRNRCEMSVLEGTPRLAKAG